MSTATEPIRALRRQLAAVAPDDLSKLDLLRFRAAAIESLTIAETQIEQFVTNFLENRKMTTSTLELDSAVDVDEALRQLDQQSEAIYREYVYGLVEGQPIKPTELRTIAADARRTPADVQRHRGIMIERRDASAAIERSKSLANSLSQLRAASDDAAAAVREMQERQAAELRPLLDAQRAAHEAYENTRHESGALRREALRILNETKSREFDAEFVRLSNIAREAGKQLEILQAAGRRRDGDRTALEREAAEYEKVIARLAKSPHPGDALENHRKALAAVQKDIAELDNLAERIQGAWREQEAAKAALAEFEQREFYNWRNMSFA